MTVSRTGDSLLPPALSPDLFISRGGAKTRRKQLRVSAPPREILALRISDQPQDSLAQRQQQRIAGERHKLRDQSTEWSTSARLRRFSVRSGNDISPQSTQS